MNERLKRLRKVLGLTQTEFAKKIGRTMQTLQKYEYGIIPLDDAITSLICATFNVNRDWFVNGVGGMFNKTSVVSSFLSTDNRVTTLRYYREVKASAGGGILNTGESSEPFLINTAFLTEAGEYVVINVIDESMEPSFKNDDKILVDMAKSHLELLPDRVYVILIGSEVVIKRYAGRVGSVATFASDNSIYPSFTVDLADESNKVIGVVKGILYRKVY